MKKNFIVAIEETVVKEFAVHAKNEDEALKIAEEKYKSGEFILAPGEVQFKHMALVSPVESEWIEF